MSDYEGAPKEYFIGPVRYIRADLVAAKSTAEGTQRDALDEKLLDVLRLADELTAAVDNEAEDIGGSRNSQEILRELGPAVDAAIEAVAQAAAELEREPASAPSESADTLFHPFCWKCDKPAPSSGGCQDENCGIRSPRSKSEENAELRRALQALARVDALLDELRAPRVQHWEGVATPLSRRGRIKALARSATAALSPAKGRKLVYNKATKKIDVVGDGLVLDSFDPPQECDGEFTR